MSSEKTTSYSLNEVLKERAAQEQHQDNPGEKTLDDLSRVKVLSPGRKVSNLFKDRKNISNPKSASSPRPVIACSPS